MGKEEIEKLVAELEEEISQLIYNKLRPYSNVTDILFRIDYDYTTTCSVINPVQIKNASGWRDCIKEDDN